MKKRLVSVLSIVLAIVGLSSCGTQTSVESDIVEDTSEKSVSGNKKIEFVCNGNGVDKPWTTYANTRRGAIPVIVWKSNNFEKSGYTPMLRCEQVSSKFQKFFAEGTLGYLGLGRFNNYPVICVAKEKNEKCLSEERILLTLADDVTDDEANEYIQQLFNVQDLASSPLTQSAMPVFFRNDEGNIVIDFRSYLQSAEVDSNF